MQQLLCFVLLSFSLHLKIGKFSKQWCEVTTTVHLAIDFGRAVKQEARADDCNGFEKANINSE